VRRYRIGGVAARTGLSEHVIRAWERRYGTPVPQRTRGGYRVYTDDDVRLLLRLRELTEEGVPISEAVRLAAERGTHSAARPSAVAAASPDRDEVRTWERAIITAAMSLDQRAVEAVLDRALSALPALVVYERLMVSVQRQVGESWGEGRLGVAEEHLISQVVRARLIRLLHAAPGNGPRHVVCACFPEDEHEIGLLGAALRFLDAGFRVTYLGARTPTAELLRVARDVRPEILALSCVLDPGARVYRRIVCKVNQSLPRGTRLVVGGRGAENHPRALDGFGLLVTGEDTWALALVG
jgi:DNA-binding transcriptional MerR regulator/methylmalonyl-CoA mutase cobalamin-binding subunit